MNGSYGASLKVSNSKPCVQFKNIPQHLFSFEEIQNGPVPLPNDKAIKEKKRKLRETLDRLLLVYVSFSETKFSGLGSEAK